MNEAQKSNTTSILTFAVISLAIAGFFTGLQSPMKTTQSVPPLRVENRETAHPATVESGVIPATHYSDMPNATRARQSHTMLTSLKSSTDPLAELKIEPEDKLQALTRRDENRAYNGAPPTIPHPIDQISDASCVACHAKGAKTESLRIPQMSHQHLSNCTQCHVEKAPRHLEPIVFRENSFNGLEAPQAGPRAFAQAPPQIPHATWMRSNCMSCHGTTGLHGIRTTHPWRNNCQQCHAPAAKLDQTFLVAEPQFLPGPQIED